MTKGRVVVIRNGGYGKYRPRISPLRFAPVEMTKGRVVVIRNGSYGKYRPQISPLRCAPVEMTKGRVVVIRNGGYGRYRPQISLLRFAPVEMTKSGDKRARYCALRVSAGSMFAILMVGRRAAKRATRTS